MPSSFSTCKVASPFKRTKTVAVIAFLFLPSLPLSSASVVRKPQREIDSLQNVFREGRHDTDRVKAGYRLGVLRGVTRYSYWDSLLPTTRLYSMEKWECRVLSSLAYSRFGSGNYEEAQKLYQQAISIARNHNMDNDLIYFYGGLGATYSMQNNVRQSLSAYYDMLKIAEKTNNKGMISAAYSGITRLYYFMNENEKALKINLNNLKIAREINDPQMIAGLLADIGSNYMTFGDTAATIRYYKESGRYAEQIGPKYRLEIYNCIGEAYNLLHKYDSAAWFFRKSYRLAKDENFTRGKVATLSLMTSNELLRGNDPAAEKYGREGLRLADSIGFIEEVSSISRILVQCYKNQGKFKEALDVLELYNSTKDSVSNEKNRKIALQHEFDYEFEKKESQNKLLAQENEIQGLQLSRDRYFLFGLGGLVLLILLFAWLLMRQNRLSADRRNTQLEQKLLLSQMNPHFIFNSLQAIQGFILKRDEKQAVKYLSAFAAITRNVLENSRMEMISLLKETALLENYLLLQKLRYGKRFDYEIRISSDIDLETTAIAPMLLQPFVENAIEHGFRNIDDDGRIVISYFLKDDRLVVEIRDNGRGLKPATGNGKHHSLSFAITRERVALMNKKTSRKVAFVVADAFPGNAERRGVQVMFSLPLARLEN